MSLAFPTAMMVIDVLCGIVLVPARAKVEAQLQRERHNIMDKSARDTDKQPILNSYIITDVYAFIR